MCLAQYRGCNIQSGLATQHFRPMMPPAVETPACYAQRPLFESVADALRRFPDAVLPDAMTLTRLLQEVAPGAATASGHAVRFVSEVPGEATYEEHLHDTGEVATRTQDWHDFFNALAWCVWPHAKAACNAAHLAERQNRAASGLAGRGARRDALTQFDECGLVVISSDAEIPRLLAAHEWEEAFWVRREQIARTTRFMVFGHGTWDQLRHPFIGLCAKVIYREVAANWMHESPTLQQADTDRWLAARIGDAQVLTSPRTLRPLPLLGIPGLTADNLEREYYRDTRQFRRAPMRAQP